MNKTMAILLAAASFFLGIIFGFLCAPIKKGISICNNGNTYNDNDPFNLYDEDEDCEYVKADDSEEDLAF